MSHGCVLLRNHHKNTQDVRKQKEILENICSEKDRRRVLPNYLRTNTSTAKSSFRGARTHLERISRQVQENISSRIQRKKNNWEEYMTAEIYMRLCSGNLSLRLSILLFALLTYHTMTKYFYFFNGCSAVLVQLLFQRSQCSYEAAAFFDGCSAV